MKVYITAVILIANCILLMPVFGKRESKGPLQMEVQGYNVRIFHASGKKGFVNDIEGQKYESNISGSITIADSERDGRVKVEIASNSFINKDSRQTDFSLSCTLTVFQTAVGTWSVIGNGDSYVGSGLTGECVRAFYQSDKDKRGVTIRIYVSLARGGNVLPQPVGAAIQKGMPKVTEGVMGWDKAEFHNIVEIGHIRIQR